MTQATSASSGGGGPAYKHRDEGSFFARMRNQFVVMMMRNMRLTVLKSIPFLTYLDACISWGKESLHVDISLSFNDSYLSLLITLNVLIYVRLYITLASIQEKHVSSSGVCAYHLHVTTMAATSLRSDSTKSKQSASFNISSKWTSIMSRQYRNCSLYFTNVYPSK
jgi:hypothetical protein